MYKNKQTNCILTLQISGSQSVLRESQGIRGQGIRGYVSVMANFQVCFFFFNYRNNALLKII